MARIASARTALARIFGRFEGVKIKLANRSGLAYSLEMEDTNMSTATTRAIQRHIDRYGPEQQKLESFLEDSWGNTFFDMRYSRFWATDNAWDVEDFCL
jgi:hypothetical protein